MSEVNAELKQTLESATKSIVKAQNCLYKGAYKRGPVRVEEIFIVEPAATRKESDQRAYELWVRYVNFLKAKENEKIVIVGTPKPFAINTEEEIRNAKVLRDQTGEMK